MIQRRESGRRLFSLVTPAVAARALVVICAVGLASSYLVTWNLWQARSSPPPLPLLSPLSSIPFGFALLATALFAMARPRLGAGLHSALFVLALLGDQVRLQPEFVSLTILLCGAAWPAKGLAVARWHVIALWAWAGLHKLLSAGWTTAGAGFIAGAFGRPQLRPLLAILVPVTEVGLALLGPWRKAWPVLRIAAPIFHVGVVVPLWMIHWNTAVWPWNLALAAATPFLFRTDQPAVATAQERSPAVGVAASLFLVYPLGFYFNVSDAYLSHNLYSANTAEASICRGPTDTGLCLTAPFATWDTLNVPLPPEPRLYVQWFDLICQPEETLRIAGVNTRLFERRTTFEPCPARAS